MRSRQIAVVGAIATLSAATAPVVNGSSARLAQADSVSISAPASVRAKTLFRFSVSYTIADLATSTSLWVGIQSAAAACAATPYDAVPGENSFAWVSFANGFPGLTVSGTGTMRFRYEQFSRGAAHVCAWLDDGNSNDPALAGPAVATITFSRPPPPPPPPPPAVFRGSGPLMTNGTPPTTYAFEIEDGSVVNFYVNTRLPCVGTTPAMTYVDWPFPFSQTNIVDWRLSADGSFAGAWSQHPGPRYSIRGRLVGSKVIGTYSEVLHPTLADRITLDAPPHQRVSGGICSARSSFVATRARS